MLIRHNGNTPEIDPDAWVAPSAVVYGDVKIGPGCRVMYGAQIIAESGSITIGNECIIMENAVLRSMEHHPLSIGNNCLIGPTAHVAGCTVEDEVFIATGASVFHSSRLGKGSEVRINGVVHLKTHLPEGETVPIGWVAVGDPVQLFPSEQHDEIWEVQKPLNFPLEVYGLDRSEASMKNITRKLSEKLGTHRDTDVVS
ncbi:gamma carbonic anhydrase family protein [Vibrio salinus]|uniref:gamma carbonic anhydrase family protein n=1 Tax=Vibrio salinus TaxID=2899784 RepID=UPI001E37C3C0|nr:gamma carbonic anhydrase family protein [Vibrio salinus]MCE0496100.1 gamma carbonic anhydrase family protein [Vibrio salinus]